MNSGLRAEGLIYTEPGMGSFVAKNAAEILKDAGQPPDAP
ncbi:hypothetical protein HEK616_67960 [Streptomyces nigrescens]|uniref:Uncharacterized protein n=1 Tax=Streptomyces nigrescens TaxID=1920 RepID=A0ABM8A3Q9_STRNI|nr:hypothetical protein HEK616_67960 [Streptomyces nigrescens]